MSQRPLFDPSRVPPEPPPKRGRPDEPLSVRQVNELVRGALQAHLAPTLHVVGEIGDVSRPASGHCYFTLRDDGAEISCVLWRSALSGAKVPPQQGMQVIVSGALDVYVPRGAYQLIVRRIEPRGAGALELAFRRLVARLEAEGLTDARRKRPLPAYPQRVALVTSPDGAALHDIVQTLRRRFAAMDVLLMPVRVQGEGAAQQIAAALETINRLADALGGIDVIIVTRGGGSLEDLWAFNEEVVARAIVASRIPVVSAVGHEVDVTVSDLVADLRAATPTAAAERITPDRAALLERLSRDAARVSRAMRQRCAAHRAELRRLLAAYPLARPLEPLRQRAQRLDEALAALLRAAAARIRHAQHRVRDAAAALERTAAGTLRRRLLARVDAAPRRFELAHRRLLARERRRLDDWTGRSVRRGPERVIGRAEERLQQLMQRLLAGATALVARGRMRLESLTQAAAAHDPQHILRRGFAVVKDARSGKLLRSITDVREGLRIEVHVADGRFKATADDPAQPRLFD
ncbi:MAG: exodeoxyribonuclease VII large subunit [Phycisphaerales bacterium]|nr:exodeoxyribonuclease VII large subunit [Phycisphaerales bacterium]